MALGGRPATRSHEPGDHPQRWETGSTRGADREIGGRPFQRSLLALLERARIRQLLAEQALSAANAAQPDAAIQLGKLLSADLFLFVQKLPVEKLAILEFKWVETRTGVTLARELLAEEDVANDLRRILSLNERAMRISALAPSERQPIAILSFRSGGARSRAGWQYRGTGGDARGGLAGESQRDSSRSETFGTVER